MKIIENLKIKEKEYIEKLENGLTVIIVPKKNTKKKYVIWGTKFGSIDNRFRMPNTKEEVFVPDGVAHFLEHKMFEQENGTNSLDVLMALGVDANAYTTNDHTAYLFETSNHFEEALEELMDYVQKPYFTDENVEKEKGIIGQEINMYNDDPSWTLYMNALDCLYEKNTIKVDTAGTVKSISKIDKEVLYKCYNTFYHPSNMVMVICGDFEPEKLLQEIKKKLLPREKQEKIERIYPEEEQKINKNYKEATMEVSNPLFMIGFKDSKKQDMIERHIAIEIILQMLVGKSSELYQKLYKEGILLTEPDLDYEFSDQYAHILIAGQSKNPERVKEELTKAITNLKENFKKGDFERLKKKIYGDYVAEYNSVGDVARMFLADTIKGIHSFDYIEKYENVTQEYTKSVLEEVLKEENEVMSIVK